MRRHACLPCRPPPDTRRPDAERSGLARDRAPQPVPAAGAAGAAGHAGLRRPRHGRWSPRARAVPGRCVAYFTAGVLLVIARRLRWSSLRIVALVNASVDALAIALILYASGGIASGLGILLVLPVLAMAVLCRAGATRF